MCRLPYGKTASRHTRRAPHAIHSESNIRTVPAVVIHKPSTRFYTPRARANKTYLFCFTAFPPGCKDISFEAHAGRVPEPRRTPGSAWDRLQPHGGLHQYGKRVEQLFDLAGLVERIFSSAAIEYRIGRRPGGLPLRGRNGTGRRASDQRHRYRCAARGSGAGRESSRAVRSPPTPRGRIRHALAARQAVGAEGGPPGRRGREGAGGLPRAHT
jgi:hypothetical protein